MTNQIFEYLALGAGYAAVGLAATGSAIATGIAGQAAIGAWKKCYAQNKPAPDMLELISEREKVPMDRIVMIGDSYVDVQMARAAGAIGIGVTDSKEMREKMAPFADEIVETLEAIEVYEH